MSFVSRQSHLIDRLLDASKSRRTLDPTGWHPTREVESHMRIAKDGRWFHEGAEIKRQEMVALFASLLRLEGDKHYLVTPVEKAIIEVEDTPFVVVDFELDFELESAGEASRLIVGTNTGDWVAVNMKGQLFMHPTLDGAGACPVVDVRGGLLGRFTRAAHFRFADRLIEHQGWFGVWSFGMFHPLEQAA